MQQCIVSVDPVSLLVLEIHQAEMALLGASAARLIGRPLAQWVTDPGRDDLSRILSVAQRSAEPRRFRATLRPAEGMSIAVEFRVTVEVRSRNQSILKIAISVLLPAISADSQKLAA